MTEFPQMRKKGVDRKGMPPHRRPKAPPRPTNEEIKVTDCNHFWHSNSGRGGDLVFRRNRQLSA
ncbi:hypothetical protein LCGC14_2083160, partial [marine sediment metagenome]